MSQSVRLVDDSGNTLLNLDSDDLSAPVALTALDLGYPTVRTATTPLSGMSGEWDVTQHTGGRAITAEVGILPAQAAVMDTIRGLMHPGLRYWLYVQMPYWPAERRIRVRGASLDMRTGGLPWIGQIGWAAPRPAFQDVTATSQTLSPRASAGGGIAFPVTLPVAFQPGLVPGAALLSVGGNANTRPTIDIYGPCSGPLVRVVDTGAQLSFPQLTINSGDYLHIDCDARTVTLNNNPALSQYQFLDFAASQWPWLPPGSPQVVFSPSSSSTPCTAVVSWRSSWL